MYIRRLRHHFFKTINEVVHTYYKAKRVTVAYVKSIPLRYDAWLVRRANRDRLVPIRFDSYTPYLFEVLRHTYGDVVYVGKGKFLPLNNRHAYFNKFVNTNHIPFYDLSTTQD